MLFGREDSGLPDRVIDKSDFLISIFMPNIQNDPNDKKGVRSLNLSVACGIAVYEAHKQISFQNSMKYNNVLQYFYVSVAQLVRAADS